jgi:hypothetical protein
MKRSFERKRGSQTEFRNQSLECATARGLVDEVRDSSASLGMTGGRAACKFCNALSGEGSGEIGARGRVG